MAAGRYILSTTQHLMRLGALVVFCVAWLLGSGHAHHDAEPRADLHVSHYHEHVHEHEDDHEHEDEGPLCWLCSAKPAGDLVLPIEPPLLNLSVDKQPSTTLTGTSAALPPVRLADPPRGPPSPCD